MERWIAGAAVLIPGHIYAKIARLLPMVHPYQPINPPRKRRQAGRTPYAPRGIMPVVMNKICLVMVLKEETAGLGRCLDSVKPLIDHWIICDVGCANGKRSVIEESLRGI